jgi:L-lysine exporter family protein LysE/ArgO
MGTGEEIKLIEAFIHGAILAFGLILPLGVQNVFIFNQGASQPTFSRALPAVITASLCDTLLILLAVLGVSIIVFTFVWIKMVLFGLGFLFLMYMGWAIWRSDSSATNGEQEKSLPIKQQVIFAASVSLLNPHAILDTVGVIGTSSLSYMGTEKWVFTLACIIISYLWFLGLAIAGRTVGGLKQSAKWLNGLNKVSAIIIWGAALYIGWRLL